MLKHFDGHGVFSGRVIDYSVSHRWYTVEYGDGDREELREDEVKPLLKAEPMSFDAAVQRPAIKVAPAEGDEPCGNPLPRPETTSKLSLVQAHVARLGGISEPQMAGAVSAHEEVVSIVARCMSDLHVSSGLFANWLGEFTLSIQNYSI